MIKNIITPTALWKDFDISQPLQEQIVEEYIQDNVIFQSVFFSGRKTRAGKVRIYGLFARPIKKQKYNTILIIPDETKTVDIELVTRFVKNGYAVLMIDYSGFVLGKSFSTYYPIDIQYGNIEKVERHRDYVDSTAFETCWYEWVGVGRYAIKYLKNRDDVNKIALLGLKSGGDIVWQLSATADDIACAIPVCANGWRGYAGTHKYNEVAEANLEDERYRFIAGVDSQSYAPLVKCPILMLCATNDSRTDADRAYDTFIRINENVEKFIYYSLRNDGCVGLGSLKNLDIFLDKYLNEKDIFLPSPLNVTVEIDEDEDLVAKVKLDEKSKYKNVRVYFAQECNDSAIRDWSKASLKKTEDEKDITFYLNAYKEVKTIFAFAYATHENGFSISSRIVLGKIQTHFKNGVDKCRIMFNTSSHNDCIVSANPLLTADCFVDTELCKVKISLEQFDILGASCFCGLKTYRMNNPIYKPMPLALLQFDANSHDESQIKVIIETKIRNEIVQFTSSVKLHGGDMWQNVLLSAKDFKDKNNKPLSDFTEGRVLSIIGDNKFSVNNILWL